MDKIALVTFVNTDMKPVAFKDEHFAMGSWRLSFSNAGGITFRKFTDRTDIYHNDVKVGSITMIDIYASVEHL